MAEISTRLSQADSLLHAARQARRNRIVLAALLLFVVSVFIFTFRHVALETRHVGTGTSTSLTAE